MESRKRSNLDHLSAQQKRQRRKLNNRVSAQHARDRKKHYIEETEKQLRLLQEENASLKKRNIDLSSSLKKFQDDNELRIAQQQSTCVSFPSPASSTRSTGSLAEHDSHGVCSYGGVVGDSRSLDLAMPESAALSVPLQQEYQVLANLRVMHWLTILTVLVIISVVSMIPCAVKETIWRHQRLNLIPCARLVDLSVSRQTLFSHLIQPWALHGRISTSI